MKMFLYTVYDELTQLSQKIYIYDNDEEAKINFNIYLKELEKNGTRIDKVKMLNIGTYYIDKAKIEDTEDIYDINNIEAFEIKRGAKTKEIQEYNKQKAGEILNNIIEHQKQLIYQKAGEKVK